MSFPGLLLIACWIAPQVEPHFQVKETSSPPPEAVPAILRNRLSGTCLEFSRDGMICGSPFPVKQLQATATREQVENGLTLDELEPMQLVGVLHLTREMTDYRNLAVPPGVYTLRLACQPESDDHKDTAPGRFFGLLCPISREKIEPPTDEKSLLDRAKIEGRNHASPWFLRLSKTGEQPLPQVAVTVPKHEMLGWKQTVKTEMETTVQRLEMALWGPHQETP